MVNSKKIVLTVLEILYLAKKLLMNIGYTIKAIKEYGRSR